MRIISARSLGICRLCSYRFECWTRKDTLERCKINRWRVYGGWVLVFGSLISFAGICVYSLGMICVGDALIVVSVLLNTKHAKLVR